MKSQDSAAFVERRAPNRADSLRSLERWLETCRLTAGLPALAVSDETGCLIAGAGLSRLCDELAALAPASLVLAPLSRKANSQSIAGGRAYLSAPVGCLDQDSLTRLAKGCARILAL
jgi:hypothetical protein